MKLRATLAAFTLLAAPLAAGSSAHAHGSTKPQYGGMVELSGEIMVELVTRAEAIDIYVTEEDAPLPATGFDAAMIVTAPDGAKSRIALEAADGNRFTGTGPLPGGAKVAVSLTEKAHGAKTFVTFRMK